MILGAILAGGSARRFGSDKAVALLDGRTLLAQVAERLVAVTDEIVVCGRDWAGLPSIPDLPGPDLGPLGGLHAALAHARTHGFRRVVTTPCDVPRVSRALLAALAEADGAVMLADMPVLGGWPTTLADTLSNHLASGGSRSMRGWATAAGATLLSSPAPANINYRADLDRLS